MELLTHIEARSSEDDRLSSEARPCSVLISTRKSPSDSRSPIPKPPTAGSRATIRGRVVGAELIPLGRADEKVKVSGESVDLARLNRILGKEFSRNVAFLWRAVSLLYRTYAWDAFVSLVYEEAQEGQLLGAIASFNENVMPFERIRAQRRVERLPRSPLGKILRSSPDPGRETGDGGVGDG